MSNEISCNNIGNMFPFKGSPKCYTMSPTQHNQNYPPFMSHSDRNLLSNIYQCEALPQWEYTWSTNANLFNTVILVQCILRYKLVSVERTHLTLTPYISKLTLSFLALVWDFEVIDVLEVWEISSDTESIVYLHSLLTQTSDEVVDVEVFLHQSLQSLVYYVPLSLVQWVPPPGVSWRPGSWERWGRRGLH